MCQLVNIRTVMKIIASSGLICTVYGCCDKTFLLIFACNLYDNPSTGAHSLCRLNAISYNHHRIDIFISPNSLIHMCSSSCGPPFHRASESFAGFSVASDTRREKEGEDRKNSFQWKRHLSFYPCSSGESSVMWLHLIARESGKCNPAMGAMGKGNKFTEKLASLFYERVYSFFISKNLRLKVQIISDKIWVSYGNARSASQSMFLSTAWAGCTLL